MKTTSVPLKQLSLIAVTALALGGASLPAQASLQLQSPVVIVDQADGEGSMILKNEASTPVLLHSDIVNLPEDQEDLLLVTPPITRMEGGDTQLVRFILKDDAQLKTERYKRATFEGIPQAIPNTVQVAVRQNIAMIIRPAGLTPNDKPWKLLKFENTAAGLTVENTGPYIVRMVETITTQPSGKTVTLPKSYVLPGEKVTATSQEPLPVIEKVSYQPASVYGFIQKPEEVTVNARQM